MNEGRQKTQIIELYVLLLVDIMCIVISFLSGNYFRHGQIGFAGQSGLYMTILNIIILICVLYSFMLNHNRDFVKRGYFVEMKVVLKMNIVIAFLITFSLFFLKKSENFARLVLAYFIIINILITYIVHVIVKRYLRLYFLTHKSRAKVLVVAEKQFAKKIIENMNDKSKYEYEIAGIAIWDWDQNTQENIAGIEIKASKSNVVDYARQSALDEVFLYIPNVAQNQLQELIQAFEEMGLVCHYNINVTGLDMRNQYVGEFAGYAVITYAMNYIDYRKRILKRGMDIIGGIIGLLIMILLFPFVAIAIKIDSEGPILFSQIRIGKNGRKFKMYKFRSMYIDAEDKKKELAFQNEISGLMFKIENDPRITRVGRFIRRTSIDELPQFYNILIGDMSLVGTRPPTVDEFEKYSGYYKRRLSMTPGLTGLWQVSGRSEIEKFEDVVKYDLHYIDYWSLSLDIKILFKTIWVVLFGKGAK